MTADMLALQSISPGGPETLRLRSVPTPCPARGEVLIAVESCGINYPDALIIEDRYQYRPPRPFAPGGEVSGTILRVGEGVTGVVPGQRVAALTPTGGLAQSMICPVERIFKIPDDIPGVEAAALGFVYATSYHALIDRAALQAGETLLVLGASGGVGLAAVQIAKALGAEVVAVVSSEEKAAAARANGADRCLVHRQEAGEALDGKQLARDLKAVVGPGGADLIYDAVGGALAEPALRSIAWGGRYLVVGFVAGIPRLPLNLALLKSCQIMGVYLGGHVERAPGELQRIVAALFDLYRAGGLRPHISARFPLERGGEAIAMLRDRKAIGKVVVDVQPPLSASAVG